MTSCCESHSRIALVVHAVETLTVKSKIHNLFNSMHEHIQENEAISKV